MQQPLIDYLYSVALQGRESVVVDTSNDTILPVGGLHINATDAFSLYRHPNTSYLRNLIHRSWTTLPRPPLGLDSLDIPILLLSAPGYSASPRTFDRLGSTDKVYCTLWKLMGRTAWLDIHSSFIEPYIRNRSPDAYMSHQLSSRSRFHYCPSLRDHVPRLYNRLSAIHNSGANLQTHLQRPFESLSSSSPAVSSPGPEAKDSVPQPGSTKLVSTVMDVELSNILGHSNEAATPGKAKYKDSDADVHPSLSGAGIDISVTKAIRELDAKIAVQNAKIDSFTSMMQDLTMTVHSIFQAVSNPDEYKTLTMEEFTARQESERGMRQQRTSVQVSDRQPVTSSPVTSVPITSAVTPSTVDLPPSTVLALNALAKV
ncbi:hypothetical protein BDK51DRAFT_52513 [Blyttiomyces helicus]|uniref:Uncharacterized protein n=1 Tax=Blyttiomyces helicus TaxID=388810 RepID=A0A4P9WGG0_9FUNG|nr:hypothetical protein BDK51DRAFT_52513 [Blyttiomyces helicus]|eukprot:RKO91901.1 hypothetical protein BDK51DRAFT_52513 [Blyttiomyces helicus]